MCAQSAKGNASFFQFNDENWKKNRFPDYPSTKRTFHLISSSSGMSPLSDEVIILLIPVFVPTIIFIKHHKHDKHHFFLKKLTTHIFTHFSTTNQLYIPISTDNPYTYESNLKYTSHYTHIQSFEGFLGPNGRKKTCTKSNNKKHGSTTIQAL